MIQVLRLKIINQNNMQKICLKKHDVYLQTKFDLPVSESQEEADWETRGAYWQAEVHLQGRFQPPLVLCHFGVSVHSRGALCSGKGWNNILPLHVLFPRWEKHSIHFQVHRFLSFFHCVTQLENSNNIKLNLTWIDTHQILLILAHWKQYGHVEP